MKKPLTFLTFVAFFLCRSFVASGQADCDALVLQRPVPQANSFIYSTPHYTMNTPVGSVTFNAVTADSAVAIVFVIWDRGETCVDQQSSIRIRFTNGEDIAMNNASEANCDGRFVLYFSAGLGNMALLPMFRENKIRYVKVSMKNKRWMRVDFADGMAYNLRKSMDCLAQKLGDPVTASPALVSITDVADDDGRKEKIDPPEFNGGEKALNTYLGRNMRRRSIFDRGVVVVSFQVDTDGNVHNPKVVRGVSEAVDNEARRLVSTLPKWKPATKNGIPVKARVEVEIAF